MDENVYNDRSTETQANDTANSYTFQGAPSPRILAIGEADSYVALLYQALGTLHARIDVAPRGGDATVALASARYDAIVLLPPIARTEGVDLCGRIRAIDRQTPLLVLDTAGSVDHVVAGLEAGADAYLIEPITVSELRARLTALLRRGAPRVNVVPIPLASAPLGALDAKKDNMRKTTLQMTKTQFPRVLAVGALVAVGALADRAAQSSQQSAAAASTAAVSAGPVASSPVSTSNASTTAATTSATVDTATENAFNKASRSVVYVENVGVGSGSGVIYDASGDIVTNAHVVAGQTSLKVTLSTGKTYPAKLVGIDVADDLAVLKINARGLPAATFATATSYRIAQTVLAIGSPLGLQQSVTSGLISALNRTVQEATGSYLPNAIQTSAPINPGNSGGALVNLNGVVVGIPTLEATDPQNNNGGAAQGIGFAVPSIRVTFVANQIIKTGTVAHTGRAYLGVGATDNSGQQSSSNGFYGGGQSTPTISGAFVGNVSNGSPAANAGVQQGDVITAANGAAVSGEADLLTALAKEKPGQTLTLSVNRNGSTMTLKAVLSELPAS